MKRLPTLTLILTTAVLISGCMLSSLRFQPATELKMTYDSSARSRDLTVYYTVKDTESSKAVDMAVQNTSGVYMSNLIINYASVKSGPGSSSYINMGNIKNRSHKPLTIKLPQDAKGTLTLRYTYLPVPEDSFLLSADSSNMETSRETMEGEIIIYID